MKSFLITGGNFANKGAQSMLITIISEIKSRYPDAKVWILPVDDYKLYPQDNLKFIVLQNHVDLFEAEKNKFKLVYLIGKNILRATLGREYVLKKIIDFSTLMEKLDYLIDISGFCLSSQFGDEYNMQLINYINSAKKHNIPVILMPQSFGPFEYKNKREWIDKIFSALSYCSVIFAREQEGYSLLSDELKLKNIILAPDMVLTSVTPNISHIFYNIKDFISSECEKITTSNNIAIIPNKRSFNEKNKEKLMVTYKNLIKYLIECKKNVYIFSHSTEDIEICNQIYKEFETVNLVHLLKKDLNCIQYSNLIRNFDFIIASRYHSIVHAYKEGIPCVVLGWATKYIDLLSSFNQSRYMFDVRNCINYDSIIKAVQVMIQKYDNESKEILSKLEILKKRDCFKFLEKKGIFDVKK